MAALKFASSQNMVAFLDKPTKSDGFEQIVDFLNAHPIKYALTIQALVDKKKVIITKTSVSNLQLEDAEAQEQEGEGSVMPTVPQHTPIINPPSISKPQKKQSRRKKRKDIEVSQPSNPTEPMADKTKNVESVPTHSNDPLLSGEDRLKLNEFMELCSSLSQRVIALETTKTNKVTLVDEGQGRNDDYLMFDTRVLDEQEVKVEKVVSTAEVNTASATTTTDNVQAMIDADYELVERLQAQEQEELTIEERSKMFVELMDKRKKHFARLRAEEQRRKTPTKA
ncbi:hypothetical protein Tco_0189209 [Tanacetum coccineum]